MSGKVTRFLVVDEVNQHINLEKKLIELQAVSGMTVDELIKKFEAGWTLKEPDRALKLADELHELTSGLYKCLQEKGVIK